MGGVGMSLPGNTGIDPSNPGHYGNLEEPTFEMGAMHHRIGVSNGMEEETKKNTALQNISLGFPASDRWTLTFGLMPFSQKNYSVRDTLNKPGIGTHVRAYEGSGRFQQLYLGNGYNIIQQGDSLVLGIGAQVNYLFGTLQDRKITEFESTSISNTRVEEELSVNRFLFEAGIHFQKRIDLHPRPGSDGEEMVPLRLMAGGSVDLPSNGDMGYGELARTYNSSSFQDTSTFIEGASVPYRFPLGYGGGISLEYDDRLKAAFEYRTRLWGQGNDEGSRLLFQDGGRDRSEMRVGFEFIPRKEYSQRASYFSYWSYRLGGRYIQESFSYEGEQVEDLGISFGFGLPLIRSSSHSTIDLGVEWSKRGPERAGLLREQSWTFFVGVSLSPHRADQWFREPKIR